MGIVSLTSIGFSTSNFVTTLTYDCVSGNCTVISVAVITWLHDYMITWLQHVYSTWDRTSTGLFKSILAIPISPLACPLPSTTAVKTINIDLAHIHVL